MRPLSSDRPSLGFDMSPMTNGVYEEAVVDVVEGESMLTDAAIVKVSPNYSPLIHHILISPHKGHKHGEGHT